ncbi:MAG: bifunctional DNA-formamidopyrimidine glycosylase/DNA-(apurinic or apyrimidinic site) lyase [Coprothermobacterota bacterium]|nr:bifunctional DNA-formamidopyrimidine glycosylase/DNA-(apurinic or apyrimidinic site) lyase [Coprothermobacterota bacterium]
MPELPEVETICRGLQQGLPGCRVKRVEVCWAGCLKNLPADQFQSRLEGCTFQEVRRRGKYLLLQLEDGQTLVVHLRMTGGFSLCPAEEPLRLHTHWWAELEDGRRLRFRDPRKFGLIYLLAPGQIESFPPLGKLGPEPLSSSFTVSCLTRLLAGSRRRVKETLLDQSKVAGIGNIYADEALFLAKVRPTRPANSLRPAEVQRLRRGIRLVLENSICSQGRSFSDYCQVNGSQGDYAPLIHDAGSSLCPSCGGAIEKIRLGGRGTYYCPRCQR